eukprot:867471-Prymnesium_polylepis.1
MVADLDRPTWLVHQAPEAERGVQRGPYARTRAKLDAGYHGCYTSERQAVQDALVARCLERGGQTSATPWLILTCGAMGVGKGRALRQLHEHATFPHVHFCVVDPDRFRKDLPETSAYIRRRMWWLLGEHTQREAGYLSELALEECLGSSRLCVYDSSLRDVGFWTSTIARIRRDYPAYSIAIYHMVAPADIVVQRASARAQQTGRFIPADVLHEAIDAAPRAFEQLRGLADFTAVLDTRGATPRLLSPSAERFAEHARQLHGAAPAAEAPGRGSERCRAQTSRL